MNGDERIRRLEAVASAARDYLSAEDTEGSMAGPWQPQHPMYYGPPELYAARKHLAFVRAMLAVALARLGEIEPKAAPSELDPDLASPPSFGAIALSCERARLDEVAPDGR